MSTELGALVIFTPRLDAVADFYRALGIPLQDEVHEDGPVHLACDLGSVHFAIFSGAPGDAPDGRSGGATMPGFAVAALGPVLSRLRALGSEVLEEPAEYPWGPRFLVKDPDGRVVEVFERRRHGKAG